MRMLARPARRIAIAATLASALAVPASESSAQTRWERLPPPAQVGLTVHDSRRNRELVFDDSGLFEILDTPELLGQQVWIGTNPLATESRFAFYDPARDRVWVMNRSVSYQDTMGIWSMDLSANPRQWTRRSFTGSFPATPGHGIYGPAYAFDPLRDRVVVFGGSPQCGFGCIGSSTSDVFTLTLGDTPNWTQEAVGGTSPSGRNSAGMVYDPWHDRMVVFGGSHWPGFGPTIYYDDTRALSLDSPLSWSLLTPSPAPPQGIAPGPAALDSLGRRWFVMGGMTGGGGSSQTLILDLTESVSSDAASWSLLVPGPWDPPGFASVFEQRGQSRILSFDGTEFWALSLGSTPEWQPALDESIGPAIRWAPVAFVDPASGRVFTSLGPNGETQYRALSPDGLWRTAPLRGPLARYGAVGVTDAAAGRGLVFGGASKFDPNLDANEYSQLWSYDFGSFAWTQLFPATSPPERAKALGVFDPTRRQLLVHGGRHTNPTATTRSDTWIYDVVTETWTSPAVGDFGGRWGEVGIYDPIRDRVVAFGGTDAARSVLNDVHVLPLGPTPGTWSELATTGTPPEWPGATSNNRVEVLAAAYDSLDDRMIVMAGTGPSTSVWALTLDSSPTWSQLSPDGPIPPLRMGAALVSDPLRQRLLLFAGLPTDGSGDACRDAWALYFDGTTPTLLSLMSADATPDRVTLRWHQGADGPIWLDVQRRAAAEAWRTAGRLFPDGTGLITWIDRDVVPGAEYEYRLAVENSAGERYYGHTRIRVPLGLSLTLQGSRPNPSDGSLIVEFSLPSGAPATLDLMDVMGRRIHAQEVGALGAGRHLIRLPRTGGPIPAGVYVLRLNQSGLTRSGKVVVTR